MAEREGFEQTIRTDNKQVADFYGRHKRCKLLICGS